MVPDSTLLYIMCLVLKGTIAKTAEFAIVRQKSIEDIESKLWDGIVESKIDCSLHCFQNTKCLLGHYHPFSKQCTIFSSDTLVSDPANEGMILIIEGRNKVPVFDDCGETNETGIVDIQGIGPVYCENTKHGGGWTVFQRRFDGSVDFNRNWENYTSNGFGYLNGEFWLGLEKLHNLTASGDFTMRVDLQDYENNTAHAIYSRFKIGDEDTAYELDISGYSGNAGDSLFWHSGFKFSTIGRDNDDWIEGSCAEAYQGGWWFTSCLFSNLNGPYLGGYQYAVVWYDWKGWISLKATEMIYDNRQHI